MIPDLHSYDHYVVFFSGGKDSCAAFLRLLDEGVDPAKIELWHHEIDGREGSTLMDWPCTPDYCRKFADAFNVPIYFSWREYGFEGEMTKQNAKSGGYYFEVPDGLYYIPSIGAHSSRMKFPQVSADLKVRWCSAHLKIDVSRRALNNQPRFNGKRTLVISGERAEESTNRAKYQPFQQHISDNRYKGHYYIWLKNARKQIVTVGTDNRHIDHWMAVHDKPEQWVWDIMQRHGVVAHPVYFVHIGRCSCQFCIFADPLQWAIAYLISQDRGETIAAYERQFGKTIKQSRKGFMELIEPKRVEAMAIIAANPVQAHALGQKEYTLPILSSPEDWELPGGAYKRSGGPT